MIPYRMHCGNIMHGAWSVDANIQLYWLTIVEAVHLVPIISRKLDFLIWKKNWNNCDARQLALDVTGISIVENEIANLGIEVMLVIRTYMRNWLSFGLFAEMFYISSYVSYKVRWSALELEIQMLAFFTSNISWLRVLFHHPCPSKLHSSPDGHSSCVSAFVPVMVYLTYRLFSNCQIH